MTEPFSIVDAMVTDATVSAPTPFVAKHQQILQGAREVFLECGYEGASVNDIAKRAGVSKGTLYNHFPDKESLFAACIQAGASQVQDQLMMALVGSQGNIEATLMALGQRYLEIWSSPECVMFMRTLEAEVGRQPKLGQLLFEAGPKCAADRVAEYLERATKKGQLTIDDPLRAAYQFFALCRAELDVPVRLALIDSVSPETARTHVHNAVRVFMKAYGPTQ